MARKTVYANHTRAELAKREHAADERRDNAPSVAPSGLLPSVAEMRERRNMFDERELWSECKRAARREMIGAQYSAEDREDCAAEIMRRLLLDTPRGCTPRRDAPAAQPLALRGVARNLRDSLDRLRARDAADAKRAAAEHAQTPAALGAHEVVSELARYGERGAQRAVELVLAKLGVTSEPDEPVWLTLYQWVTASTAAEVAERRGLGVKLAEKRIATGARFMREHYSVAELGALLALGARDGSPIRLVVADLSREAHGHSPILADAPNAPHWREGTDAGTRAARHESAESARQTCELGKLTREQRAHWRKHRKHRADHDERITDAHANLARAHARTAKRRPRGASAESDLVRAALA